LAVNDYLHLRKRALAGDIITELPPFLAADALRDGHLIPLLSEHPFPEQDVTLLYQQQWHPSTVIRAYLDFCVSRASAYVSATRHPLSPRTRRKGKRSGLSFR
jgi:DNA-binding transcriptional LysR family regulator